MLKIKPPDKYCGSYTPRVTQKSRMCLNGVIKYGTNTCALFSHYPAYHLPAGGVYK
jgi:hypothetical protein